VQKPQSVREAARGVIEVAAGSVHQRTLEDLRLQQPDLAWVQRSESDTEELLADVSRGTVQYTLASSTEFALNRPMNPDLSIALDLSPERAVSWVIETPGHDMSLLGRVNAFFTAARAEGLIAAVLERYYDPQYGFDYLLSRNFMEHVGSRLPRYQQWFQDAAAEYDLDWRLLAAMGYQESKWDASAVSYTGVRGPHAAHGRYGGFHCAGDRLDAKSRASSGARKYLSQLRRTIPERIVEPGSHVARGRRVQRRLRPSRGCAGPRAAGRPQLGQVGRSA
jgi:membrane-bound lytic murein transglycosylase F